MSKKLTIIGTYHILSAKDKVKGEILKRKPQAVAIELDQERYDEIVSGKQPTQLIGEIMRSLQDYLAEDQEMILEGLSMVQKKLVRRLS